MVPESLHDTAIGFTELTSKLWVMMVNMGKIACLA